MLALTTPQMVELRDRRLAASHRRVADYLCKVHPVYAPSLPAAELTAFVPRADASGRSLGIRTEAGHKRWAYLVMTSEGRVLQSPGTLRFIKSEGASPDDQVRILIGRLADHIGAGAARSRA